MNWSEWKHRWFFDPKAREIGTEPLQKYNRTDTHGGGNPPAAKGGQPATALQEGNNPTGDHAAWLGSDMPFLERHVVLPDPRGQPGSNANRFVGPSPSHGLTTLQNALRQYGRAAWAPYTGRRIFLLLTPPGAGKGHVFTSLSTSDGLNQFAAASWGCQISDQPISVYEGALFQNLGFSHEVSSTFDRIGRFLDDRWDKVFQPTGLKRKALGEYKKIREQRNNAQTRLGNDRRAYIREILELYQRTSEIPGLAAGNRRLIIATNNIGALYDRSEGPNARGGTPKNIGLHRMLHLFFAEFCQDIPVDFVFLFSTYTVPPLFSDLPVASVKGSEGSEHERMSDGRMLLSTAPNTRPSHINSVEYLMSAAGIAPPARKFSELKSKKSHIVVCHVIRRAPTVALAGVYFPRVAMALCLGVIKEHRKPSWPAMPNIERAGFRISLGEL